MESWSKTHNDSHFHGIYGEYEITVELESGVINGRFPRRALRLVLEWLELHKDELLELFTYSLCYFYLGPVFL